MARIADADRKDVDVVLITISEVVLVSIYLMFSCVGRLPIWQ